VLKKTITYENLFTEQTVTEDHYFHISKADLVEMEMEEHKDEYTSKSGEKLTGMQAKLQRIMDSEDGKAILTEFKDMIRRAYGRKDGDRFIKSPEVWAEFSSSEAYSQLIFDLCTDASQAAEFINGIVPGDLEKIAAEVRERAAVLNAQQAATNGDAPAETPALAKAETALSTDEDPTGLTKDVTPRVLTQKEIEEMDSDDLKSGLRTGRYKLS
jgi:hypothetical protein